MMEQLAEQGVVHAEVYISVGVIYMWRNHDPACFEPIFAGLERARERAAARVGPLPLLDLRRRAPLHRPEAERVFRKAAELRARYPSIIGIGLGGDERRPAPRHSTLSIAEAARAGLRLTNHAGETTGPEAIWDALAIGSERIGHALSAIQDSALLQDLKDRQVPMEMNPTSNVRTGVCPSFAGHPLRRCFDLGLLVTLNSDDPAFFGSDLANEYLLAHTEQDFTPRGTAAAGRQLLSRQFSSRSGKNKMACPHRN